MTVGADGTLQVPGPDGVGVSVGTDGVLHLPRLLAARYGMSSSEARRLIDQGGVSLDEVPAGARAL